MRPRTKTQKIVATTAADAKAWAIHLGCSVAELRIALRAVGTSTASVKAYLAALSGREQSTSSAVQADGDQATDDQPPSPTYFPVWPTTPRQGP